MADHHSNDDMPEFDPFDDDAEWSDDDDELVEEVDGELDPAGAVVESDDENEPTHEPPNRRERRKKPKPAPEARSVHRASRRAMPEPFHLDRDVLVFNKPAGFPVVLGPDGEAALPEFSSRTLSDIGPLFGIVPIDNDSAGVALIARSRSAQQKLADELVDRTLEVTVLALVRRAPFGAEQGIIEKPIGVDRHRPGRMRIDVDHGRPAVTEWRVRDVYVGYTLLECRPRSAVAEQVRVHLAAAGMPLAVDPEYGGAGQLRLSSFKAGYRPSHRRPERPLIQRASLHFESIQFRHPESGAAMRFDAPMPKDIRAALHQLDRFGRVAPG